MRDGNEIVDSGSGLVDGDTVYLVNVGGTSRDKRPGSHVTPQGGFGASGFGFRGD